MHTILRFYLRCLARLILWIKKPTIIGITGTVGKTTVTASVVAYLTHAFSARDVQYSEYHYNGEFGFPLTIIGAKSPGKNIFGWLRVGLIALARLFKPYPKYLVGEYGIDHPGEMDFLVSIGAPSIVILTPIEANHIEQFGTIEAYRNEKLKITKYAHTIVAHESLKEYTHKDAYFYGTSAGSDIIANDIVIGLDGTKASVSVFGETSSVHIPAIGGFQIQNILPLFVLARIFDQNIDGVVQVVAGLHPESGRSRILPGIHGATIIDGTYNGGYTSIREGLISLKNMPATHDIYCFLGDMRELGTLTEELHTQLARDITALFADKKPYFFLVGPSMAQYVAPLLTEFTVQTSLSSRELGKRMKHLIETSTSPVLVYAKGSQNTIFLEEGLKYILPKEAHSHLCRNSPEWQAKKEAFFRSL